MPKQKCVECGENWATEGQPKLWCEDCDGKTDQWDRSDVTPKGNWN